MLTNVTVCDMLSDWRVDFSRKGGEKLSEVKFDPERLKAAMKARRPPMGNTTLAKLAGISRQTVFYLLNGQRKAVSAEILSKKVRPPRAQKKSYRPEDYGYILPE